MLTFGFLLNQGVRTVQKLDETQPCQRKHVRKTGVRVRKTDVLRRAVVWRLF
jgi:hypothetical protein